MTDNSEDHPSAQGSPGEVFRVFLRLGLTSFGGPIAHLGYFREELVLRRKWITEDAYGELVALCQFLPGPASSQVGFALGLARGGWLGAGAAWAAFTLPSAILMVLFAYSAASLTHPIALGALQGLKVVAVAVVTHALWGMMRALCPDQARATIAIAALVALAFMPVPLVQVGVILAGVICGIVLVKPTDQTSEAGFPVPVGRATGIAALAILIGTAAVLAAISHLGGLAALADALFRAGALVFGGGHVVLPLLETGMVPTGWVAADDFLAGYGAAQAMPGPLFTFGAFLGAMSSEGPGGPVGAAVALIAVFLPGLLVLVGVLPFWSRIRQMPKMHAGIAGANAAVVGVLGSALYAPVFTSAVTGPIHFALAVVLFALLQVWRTPAWMVVLIGGVAGSLLFGLLWVT